MRIKIFLISGSLPAIASRCIQRVEDLERRYFFTKVCKLVFCRDLIFKPNLARPAAGRGRVTDRITFPCQPRSQATHCAFVVVPPLIAGLLCHIRGFGSLFNPRPEAVLRELLTG